MKKTICSLFEVYDYKIVYEKENITIFQHKRYEDYWTVVELNSLEDFKQEEMFTINMGLLKNDKAAEKNLTMLILLEVESLDNIIRRKIIDTENDPYYYKKYVLSYTSEDKRELLSIVESPNKISRMLMDPECFNCLKKEMYTEQAGCYHLLYAIAHKMPFVLMNIERKENSLANRYVPNNKQRELYEWAMTVDIDTLEQNICKSEQ